MTPPLLSAALALTLWSSPLAAQATFTVTSASDPGTGACDAPECTLREAIEAANGAPNGAQPDRIHFAIPGSGLHTITPLTPLPTITDPVVIDGYTQPGASPNTLAVGNDAVLQIELNGDGAAFRVFEITGGGSTVRGLVINRFSGNGPTDAFQLRTLGGNTIAGNWIGTSADGTTAQNNSRAGLYLFNSTGNTIGGTRPADRNVILGSLNPAVYDEGTGGGHTVQGNYVGTDAQGITPLGQTGITLSTGNNLIGGTGPGAGNVISVTGRDGVALLEGGASNNRIEGNRIGVGADGTSPLGLLTCVLIQRGSDNVVGGGDPAARNLLAGASGVRIVGGGGAAERNRVQGNWMGLTASGTALVLSGGGAGVGVGVSGAVDTAVGGTGLGEGNVIAGYVTGVRVDFGGAPNAAGTRIQANWIGTDANGSAALGNGTGVVLFGEAPGNGTVVGGPGGGNVISGNRGDGVSVSGPATLTVQDNLIGVGANGSFPLGNGGNGVVSNSGALAVTGNVIAHSGAGGNDRAVGVWVTGGPGTAILQNAIYDNARAGIDLLATGSTGATPNDPRDADEGPNRLQNTPELLTATRSGGQITLGYRVDTAIANAAYPLRIQIFGAEGGQGAALIGGDTYVSADYAACGSPPCTKTIAFFPNVFLGSDTIVATATDLDGNTSEFSPAISLGAGTPTETEAPAATALFAPAPNPAGPHVTLRYVRAAPGPVRLAVVDALGRVVAVVADGERPAGEGAADLDTSALAAGPYTVQLTAGAVMQSRRLVVVR